MTADTTAGPPAAVHLPAGARHRADGSGPRPAARGPGAGFRPELQGLRAVAVMAVVLYHLWPMHVSGGYVGVDVFFVVSGFLITSHVVREVMGTGTVRVGRFWARRIRRLLPASLLVLALSAVAVVLVMPATVWAQTARQLGASALYVQNWALALDAVDYMAADNVPTVAQHYWSLSVEEQFYLVWPLLVLGLVALAARRAGGRPGPVAVRRALVLGLGLLALVSLGWSVLSTAQDQAFAYLSTLTRVWEFAAGALTALVVLRTPWPPAVRAALGWAGLLAIAASALLFTEQSAFPGWIALVPVLGTVAVIAAGTGRGPAAPGTWLSLRPARFLGDISYSVYLWHWPLVVLAPATLGRTVFWQDKLVLLALTLLLAWGSKVLVEDPMRTRPLLAAAPWRAYAFAVAGMLAVVGGSAGIRAELDRRETASGVAAEQALAAAEACTGPGALVPANGCDGVVGDGPLLVAPEVVALQNSQPPYRGCQQTLEPSEVLSCDLGETEDPVRTVALVGDSHATQWFTAFDRLGREQGWKVVTFTRTSCPFSTAVRVLPTEQTGAGEESCSRWVDDVGAAVAAEPDVSEVFVASYSTAYGWRSRPDAPAAEGEAAAVAGFGAVWSGLREAGLGVTVLAAVPRTNGENVPNCVAADPDDRSVCEVPRAEALPGDVMLAAVDELGDPGVRAIDLSDLFCDDATCYPVVGGVVVYRDHSHLSAEYSTLLLPFLLERYEALGPLP